MKLYREHFYIQLLIINSMHPTLSQAVKDMTGENRMSEEQAKEYVSKHWIPFQIYMKVSLKIEEAKKPKPTRIRKPYTYKK